VQKVMNFIGPLKVADFDPLFFISFEPENSIGPLKVTDIIHLVFISFEPKNTKTELEYTSKTLHHLIKSHLRPIGVSKDPPVLASWALILLSNCKVLLIGL
jgi:hypothetical protein